MTANRNRDIFELACWQDLETEECEHISLLHRGDLRKALSNAREIEA